MNENYLWDKTGSDSEIEKLENALQVFRHKETAAPQLPSKVFPFKPKVARRSFSFGLKIAACIAFGVLSLGIWFQVLRTNLKPGSETAKNLSVQKEASSETKPINQPDVSIYKTANTAKKFSEVKVIKARQNVPATASRKVLRAQNTKFIKPDVKLTSEEKYAYSQLMLALSITSSNLKAVQDKAEGLESQARNF